MDSNIVGIAFRDEERVITEANDAFFRLKDKNVREDPTNEAGTGLVFALDIGELNRLEEKLRHTAKLESTNSRRWNRPRFQ